MQLEPLALRKAGQFGMPSLGRLFAEKKIKICRCWERNLVKMGPRLGDRKAVPHSGPHIYILQEAVQFEIGKTGHLGGPFSSWKREPNNKQIRVF